MDALSKELNERREAIRNARTANELIEALGCGHLGEAGYYVTMVWEALRDRLMFPLPHEGANNVKY